MKINGFLKWFIIVGLALVILIPIIPGVAVATSMFFPFITGKNFAFRIFTELIFGAWLILAVRNSAYRPKFSWLGAAVGALAHLVCDACATSAFGERRPRPDHLAARLSESIDDQIDRDAWLVMDAAARLRASAP